MNFQHHHVPVAGLCPLCHSSCDSTLIALFFCPRVRSCWNGTKFWSLIKQVHYMESLDLFGWMMENLHRNDFEAFAMRAWATWSERLGVIHDKKNRKSELNSDWCDSLLSEFQHARAYFLTTKDDDKAASPEKWLAPPKNCLRLDVDAAYNEKSNEFSFGGVIRNHKGHPFLAFGRPFVQPTSVKVAELLAIEGGLRIAQENGFHVHVLTSDSLLAVQAVTCLEEDRSYVGSIATDVRSLLEQQRDINVIHVRRSANKVAHALAAFVISSSFQFVWDLENFPLWLNKLVMMDISISQ